MKLRGQWFDNEAYALSVKDSQTIAKAAQNALDEEPDRYVYIAGGSNEVKLTLLCEDMYYTMNFPDDSCLADREEGIDEIVFLVCAGEGLL